MMHLKVIVVLHDNVYQLLLLEYTVRLFPAMSDTKNANVTRFQSEDLEYNTFFNRYEHRRSII